jgi:hypothetical protein
MLLVKLYTPVAVPETEGTQAGMTYVVGEDSPLYMSIPQSTPSSFIQQGISFVDRVFALFGFIQVLVGVLLFPAALLSFMGLPWQILTLLIPALTGLYVFGLIDIISGGDS